MVPRTSRLRVKRCEGVRFLTYLAAPLEVAKSKRRPIEYGGVISRYSSFICEVQPEKGTKNIMVFGCSYWINPRDVIPYRRSGRSNFHFYNKIYEGSIVVVGYSPCMYEQGLRGVVFGVMGFGGLFDKVHEAIERGIYESADNEYNSLSEVFEPECVPLKVKYFLGGNTDPAFLRRILSDLLTESPAKLDGIDRTNSFIDLRKIEADEEFVSVNLMVKQQFAVDVWDILREHLLR